MNDERQHIFDFTRMSPGSQGQGGIRIAALMAAIRLAQTRSTLVVARPEQVDWMARDLRDLSDGGVLPRIATAESIADAVLAYGTDVVWWDLLNGRTTGDSALTTVSLVADLLFKDHPGFFEDRELAAREDEYGATIREASVLLTLSQRQVDRIEHWYGRADAVALHFPPGLSPQAVTEVANGEGPQVAPRRTWLFPAVGWPHKNHYRLVQAFLLAVRSKEFPADVDLVLSAQQSREWSAINWTELALTTPRIRTIPYMTDADYHDYLRSVDAIIYPSIHEGYGLPPLEALVLGIPLLTSQVPALEDLSAEWLDEEPSYFTDVTSVGAMTRDLVQFAAKHATVRAGKGGPSGITIRLHERFSSEMDEIVRLAEAKHRAARKWTIPSETVEGFDSWEFRHLRPATMEDACLSAHIDTDFLPEEESDDYRALMSILHHADGRYVGVRLGGWRDPDHDMVQRCSHLLRNRHVSGPVLSLADNDGEWFLFDRLRSWGVVEECRSVRDLRARALRLAENDEWTLVYVDSGLTEASGHHLEVADRICSAATVQGGKAVVLAPIGSNVTLRSALVRAALHSFATAWDPESSDPGLAAWQLEELTADLSLTAHDIVYLPSVPPTLLLGVIGWLLSRASAEMPHIVATIDRASSAYPATAYDYVDCATALRRHSLGDCLEIRAESIQLQEYLGHCGFERVLLRSSPLPTDLTRAAKASKSIRVVFPGNAREEKGFELLPDLLSHLFKAESHEHIEAHVQVDVDRANASPAIISTVDRLRALAQSEPRLRLVGHLNSLEYKEMLATADIAVLPYNSESYVARGSGVAAEALRGGALIVTTPNTDVAATYECEFVRVAATATSEGVAAAVLEAMLILSCNASLEAITCLPSGLVIQNAEEAIEEMLKARSLTTKAKLQGAPRVVVVVVNGTVRQGNSAVFASQTGALTRLGYRVIVLELPYPSWDSYRDGDDFNLGQFLVSGRIPGRYRDRETLEGLLSLVASRGPSLELFTRSAEAVDWPAWILDALARVGDVVLLVNYVFNFPVAGKLGLPPRTTRVVETHDINEVQFALLNSREPMSVRVDGEFNLLKKHFDHVISISASECASMAAVVGADRVSHVLPSLDPWEPMPSDGALGRLPIVGAERSSLQGQVPLLSLVDQHCDLLFLGSDHPANVSSLDWFLGAVFYPYLQSQGVTLLIAGRVGAKSAIRSRRGIQVAGELQRVGDAFRSTTCSVLPIRAGTGVPIKILDAWRHGHPFSITDYPLAALGVADTLPSVQTGGEMAADISALLQDEQRALLRGELGRSLYRNLCGHDRYTESIARVIAQADHTAELRIGSAVSYSNWVAK